MDVGHGEILLDHGSNEQIETVCSYPPPLSRADRRGRRNAFTGPRVAAEVTAVATGVEDQNLQRTVLGRADRAVACFSRGISST